MTIIKLGDREFEMPRHTLRQLMPVATALADMANADVACAVEAAARVVAVALAPGHPDVTADAILDIDGATMDELSAAVQVILGAAGLGVKTVEPVALTE